MAFAMLERYSFSRYLCHFLHTSFTLLYWKIWSTGRRSDQPWLLSRLSARAKSPLSADHETVVCIIFDLRFGFQFAMALGYNEWRVRMVETLKSWIMA
jgi:hypothetical protein